jgi:hypothetical protein
MGSVRKRSTGAWEARWSGPDGRQHSRICAGKTEARRHVRAMEGAVVRGDYLDPNLGRTLFRVVAEEWFETTVQRTPKTRAGYRHILDLHLLPTFGSQPVGRIDAAAIDRFTAGLTVAPATARNILRVLSPVLKYAVKARMIVRNPVEDAAKPKVARPSSDATSSQAHCAVAQKKHLTSSPPWARPCVSPRQLRLVDGLAHRFGPRWTAGWEGVASSPGPLAAATRSNASISAGRRPRRLPRAAAPK